MTNSSCFQADQHFVRSFLSFLEYWTEPEHSNIATKHVSQTRKFSVCMGSFIRLLCLLSSTYWGPRKKCWMENVTAHCTEAPFALVPLLWRHKYRTTTPFGPPMWQMEGDNVGYMSSFPETGVGQKALHVANRRYLTVLKHFIDRSKVCDRFCGNIKTFDWRVWH